MATYNITVPLTNGAYDGDMVVKQYSSLTINAGNTLTTSQPCRGLLILVQGDCTINGTLSMKARGASADPTTGSGYDGYAVNANGLQLPFLTDGGTSTLTASASLFNGAGNEARNTVANFRSISGNGSVLTVSRTGAGDTNYFTNGTSPRNGSTGSYSASGCGGGGSGSSGYDHGGSNSACNGTSGTCYGGGSGGGGVNGTNGLPNYSLLNANPYGGESGSGWAGHTSWCTAGAGNPNGGVTNTGGDGGAREVSHGEIGTGGVIWLVVGGNLTIGSSGLITVQGSRSNSIDGNGYNWLSTGGGSGGGAIRIAHRGTFTNNGSIDYSGGLAGTWFDGGNGAYCSNGGNGGSGSYQAIQVL